MSVGLPNDRASLDLRLGQLALALRTDADDVLKVQAMLADTTRFSDAILMAAPPDGYGYTSAEVSNIRASILALANWVKIGDAQLTQPALNNFWFDAAKWLGVKR